MAQSSVIQFPILQLDRVSKQFSKTGAPAVDHITLTLDQGEILGLLGPSGCGKTTLLRLIAGFEQPNDGRIAIANQTVASHNTCIAPECRSIGMVFQDFALFPHLTVAENVAFGLKKGRTSQAEIQQRVDEAIALVGLQGKERSYPHELSGGQQQRVALARALAPRPSLILLDEPLSNLDVQVRLYLRQEVRDILKATGTSAIFVTHDQEEALAISDRVAVMRHGQIEQLDTPEKIYSDPASRFVAEFVTQANFLPTQQRGAFWQTEIGTFGIDVVSCTCQADWEICLNESTSGMLMIPQEDLVPTANSSGHAVIHDRQFLGREYSYTLITNEGNKLTARTHARTALAIGTRVKLSVQGQAMRFFPDMAALRSADSVSLETASHSRN